MKTIVTSNYGIKQVDFDQDDQLNNIVHDTTGNSHARNPIYVRDPVHPYLVYYNPVRRMINRFDLTKNTNLSSYTSNQIVDVKSIQLDRSSGSIYAIQPYELITYDLTDLESSSSFEDALDNNDLYQLLLGLGFTEEEALQILGLSQEALIPSAIPNEMPGGGGIVKLNSMLSNMEHLDLGNIVLNFPQDMKIDSQRRYIWVADTGGNRILKINLNTLALITSFDILLPVSLELDPEADAVFCLHYDENLKQSLSYIKNSSTIYSFDTENDIGFSNYYYGRENNTGELLVVDNGQETIVKIDKDDNTSTWRSLRGNSAASVSYSGVNGTALIKYDDGIVEKIYNNRKLYGEEFYLPCPANDVFTNHLKGSHYSFYYDGDINKYYLVDIPVRDTASSDSVTSNITFNDIQSGDCCYLTGQTYLISDGGYKVEKINGDLTQILSEKELAKKHDLISISPKENYIWIAEKNSTMLSYLDSSLGTVTAVTGISKNIVDIKSDLYDDEYLWILFSDSVMRYRVTDGTSVSLNLIVSKLRKLVPIVTGGAWIASKSQVIKISQDGLSQTKKFSGFTSIKNICAVNYLKDYSEENLPQAGSIKYDYVRRNVAWVYDEKLYVGNVDTKHAIIVDDFEVEDIFSSSSSMSSSSSQRSITISKSSSSLSSSSLSSSSVSSSSNSSSNTVSSVSSSSNSSSNTVSSVSSSSTKEMSSSTTINRSTSSTSSSSESSSSESSSSASFTSSSLSSTSSLTLSTSSSSTVEKSTSSSASSQSISSSESSSSGLIFDVLDRQSISNYSAIGQSYGFDAASADICDYLPFNGADRVYSEGRVWTDENNPSTRIDLPDSTYEFESELESHEASSVFINLMDSGNLQELDSRFENLEFEGFENVPHDYPYWGIKGLWVEYFDEDKNSLGKKWLDIQNESSSRESLALLNSDGVFEGVTQTNNGEDWIGRNRNIQLVYRISGLPEHTYIKVFAEIHFRGFWLGCAEQTVWNYNEGATITVVNPYDPEYVEPPPPANTEEDVQYLSHGPQTLSIWVS